MKFNTKIIEFITSLHNEGQDWKSMFVETPFYERDPEIRKDNVSFEFTPTEMEEYVKCSQDIIYFAEKYCNIKLRQYQIDILKNYEAHNKILHVKSRQIGSTLLNAIYLLHFSIFNVDKNVLIVANLRATCSEIIDKIQNIYRKLPFFLKPGVKNWNQASIIFSTGCKIKSSARSKEPSIVSTIDLLYIDEFAHIPSNIIEQYYITMTVKYNVSKMIISSTPNGTNLFYKLYKQKDSLYKIIETPYNVIEGRDEKWKEKTIKEIGGIHAFEQEFELNFHDENKLGKTIEILEERINKIEMNDKKNYFIVLCIKDVPCNYDDTFRMKAGSLYNLEIRDNSYSFSWNKNNIHPVNSHSSCWFDNNSNPNIISIKEHYVVVDEMYIDILHKIKKDKEESYINNITGDITTYKIPSNNDLLERIIKIESNINIILSKLNMISD